MSDLPKKFPEYSIMHKTLVRQIEELKKREKPAHGDEVKEMQLKIKRYQAELKRIEGMFPDNFFDKK